MDSTIGSRLRQLAEGTTGSVRKLADVAGIPYRSLQNYVADSQLPGAEVLTKLAVHVNANINWLLTGEGSMKRHSNGQLNTKLLMLIGSELRAARDSTTSEKAKRLTNSLYTIGNIYNSIAQKVSSDRLSEFSMDDNLIEDLVNQKVEQLIEDAQDDVN